MWQFWGTLSVSALGGTFLLHYLKNFILGEKEGFHWDRDGIIERALITYLVASLSPFWYLIPVIILIKLAFRLFLIGRYETLVKVKDPGTVPQKVRLKSELAFDLIISPAFAILVGIIF